MRKTYIVPIDHSDSGLYDTVCFESPDTGIIGKIFWFSLRPEIITEFTKVVCSRCISSVSRTLNADPSRCEFLINRLSRTHSPDSVLVEQLRSLVPEFTVRDCLKVIAVGWRTSATAAVLPEAFSRLTSDSGERLADVVGPENLELCLLALTRVKSAISDALIRTICSKFSQSSELSSWLSAMQTKELANIANIVSRTSFELNASLMPICVKRLAYTDCDHRSGSLIVCALSRQLSIIGDVSPYIEAWCSDQNEKMSEWSAQSIALFVSSLPKIMGTKDVSFNMKSLIHNLVNNSNTILSNYTNQNLCNLIAGLVKLQCTVDLKRLLDELGSRNLLKKDVLYLSRVRHAHVSNFLVSQLSNPVCLKDLAVLCDIAPLEYENMRDTLIRSLENILNSGRIKEEDTEKMFFAVSKLNYRPPAFVSVTIPLSMSSEKAALCLFAIFRQEIKVAAQTLSRLVGIVLTGPASPSDLTTTLLAIVSIPEATRAVDAESIKLLIDKISMSVLNPVDLRQIYKAVSVIDLLNLQLPLNPLTSLLDNNVASLPGNPVTSKGHSEALLTLKNVVKSKSVTSEVHAPPLVIDILVS